MKECIHCGARLDTDAAYCRYCGIPQDGSVDPSAEYHSGPQPAAQEPPRAEPPKERRQAPPPPPPPPPGPDYRYGAPGPGQPGQQWQPNQGQAGNQYQQPPQGNPPPGEQPYGSAPYGPPPYGPPPYVQPQYRNLNRVTAGVLALLLGWVGVHKFYMGKIAQGVVMAVFSFSGVPAVIAIVEGILYLTMSDYNFREKYCRLP